jgi:long-chain fatty acid transport protein
VLALGINAPFGAVTEASNKNWAGQTFGTKTELKTYNFTPTLAFKLAPSLAFGVGLQIERIEGKINSALTTTANAPESYLKASDTAMGATAGVNWTPTSETSVGLGYRSGVNHNLKGTSEAPIKAPGLSPAGGDISMPSMVTLSLRQGVTQNLTALATVEWTNWSRLQKLDIVCTGPGNLCPGGVGQPLKTLAFGWHDSWMMSVGGEYKYGSALTLRSGLAYEISPVQDATERSTRIPDRDRLWASMGATYKWSEKMAFDLGYSHIFGIGNGDIDRTEVLGGNSLRFRGKVDTHADIVSASVKTKW